MAGQNAEWIQRKQIEMDSVKYDITVAESGGDYSGTWNCQECGERGASALKSASADQAMERAQVNLYAHHTLVHSESSHEN